MAKSPAFRFYPSDFMGSPDVQAMDLHEVGAYTLLLCTAWLAERHGHLPDDDDRLRRWARMTKEQWSESRACLLRKFPVVESGWRANPRMVDEAKKQVLFSESRSANGRLGGRPSKKLVLSENKQVVSKQKLEESTAKATQKPSVSVSAFVSVSGAETPKATAKTGASAFVLPNWIDAKVWNQYEEMRRKIRKPMLDSTRELAVKKLQAFENRGINAVDVLNNSILNSYQGLFEPATTNGGSNGANRQHQTESRADRNVREAIELMDREAAEAAGRGSERSRSVC